MEDVLADLYKATRKYGEVGPVSFLKRHCRRRGFHIVLMAPADAAGDGSYPNWRRT